MAEWLAASVLGSVWGGWLVGGLAVLGGSLGWKVMRERPRGWTVALAATLVVLWMAGSAVRAVWRTYNFFLAPALRATVFDNDRCAGRFFFQFKGPLPRVFVVNGATRFHDLYLRVPPQGVTKYILGYGGAAVPIGNPYSSNAEAYGEAVKAANERLDEIALARLGIEYLYVPGFYSTAEQRARLHELAERGNAEAREGV
jgi:hypothetical protein